MVDLQTAPEFVSPSSNFFVLGPRIPWQWTILIKPPLNHGILGGINDDFPIKLPFMGEFSFATFEELIPLETTVYLSATNHHL